MSAGFAAARSVLEVAFRDAWEAGAFSATPIAFENVDHDPADVKDPFIRFDDLRGDGQQITVGHDIPNVIDEWAGVAQVTLYVPQDEGTGELDDMADAVGAILTRMSIVDATAGNIQLETSSFRSIGPGGPGGAYHVGVVDCRYRRWKTAA